uniref:Uncharacterized protein n=1 Tax=Macrostomum lignano TaxID=282301 RepID=A0A1I8FFA9_9PLAT
MRTIGEDFCGPVGRVACGVGLGDTKVLLALARNFIRFRLNKKRSNFGQRQFRPLVGAAAPAGAAAAAPGVGEAPIVAGAEVAPITRLPPRRNTVAPIRSGGGVAKRSRNIRGRGGGGAPSRWQLGRGREARRPIVKPRPRSFSSCVVRVRVRSGAGVRRWRQSMRRGGAAATAGASATPRAPSEALQSPIRRRAFLSEPWFGCEFQMTGSTTITAATKTGASLERTYLMQARALIQAQKERLPPNASGGGCWFAATAAGVSLPEAAAAVTTSLLVAAAGNNSQNGGFRRARGFGNGWPRGGGRRGGRRGGWAGYRVDVLTRWS